MVWILLSLQGIVEDVLYNEDLNMQVVCSVVVDSSVVVMKLVMVLILVQETES